MADSRLIGRANEVELVTQLLGTHPVVTLTGPGGIGKTTLADAVAAAVSTTSDQGSLRLDLTGVREPDDVRQSLAQQLGHESADSFALAAGDAPCLLVVDNCESALGAAATLVGALVDASNDLTVLATSRTQLGVAGERIVAVEPLPLPSGQDADSATASAAVQLFGARAAEAGASWSFEEHAADVARIVERLDGMPLAIELAAARTRAIGPAEFGELLDRQLDVLKRPSDDPDARHRSIRGAIYTSYDPLSAEQKRVFRRLSVVPHHVDLDLAHRLCGHDDKLATIDTMTALVDNSLVTTGTRDGESTFRLLEPIRAYGREQLEILSETDEAEEALVAAMTSIADDLVAAAIASIASSTLDRIARDSLLLLTALDAALVRDDTPDRAFRLILPFYAPTPIPRAEVAARGTHLLGRWPAETAPMRAEALAVMAHSSMWAGNDEDALHRASLALEDPGATGLARLIALRVKGFTAALQGDPEAGVRHLEEAIEEAEAFGGSFARELRMSWASMVPAPSRSEEALEVLEVAARGAAENDERVPLVWATVASAHHRVLLGDLDGAQRCARRAIDLADTTEAPWPRCTAARAMACVAVHRGDWEEAREWFVRAIDIEASIGDLEGVALTIRTAAAAAAFAGDASTAETLWHLVPPRRGISSLPHLFAESEDRLRATLGTPVPLALTESVGGARRALRVTDTDQRPSADAGEAGDSGGNTVISFSGYEIDVDGHELRHDGERVHVEPQVFEVLAHLALRPGRLITKEELFDEIWGDRFVSPSALTSRIKSARAATGDDGRAQRIIRTVHGRGFMFVAETF